MKRLLCISLVMVSTGGAMVGRGSWSRARAMKIVVTGRVYDRNHALIVLSEVTAENADGKNYRAMVDGEGVYKIELPLDEYRIEANAPGFCPRRFNLVRAQKQAGKKSLDFVLEMAQSDRPCAQQSMIKKAPRAKPGIPKNIAE